ncbi:mRNA capping enzyme, large subunit [Sarocladium strictum]
MANHDSNDHDASRRNNKRRADDGQDDDLPQPYSAAQLQSVKRRAVSPSDQPRKQKRPGARARLTDADRDAIRRRQEEREAQLAADDAAAVERTRQRGGINDVVRQHYNSVPERGREWRTTDSKIKGLRAFNNWVKSCIIQRYSPDEDHTPGSREMGRSSGNELLVLDIGCGKGGDLNKWQQAPQPIQLYVGLDPADVSIEQARDRYRTMQRGGPGGGRGGYNRRPPPRVFDARFAVKDCYSESIEELEIIQQVGFDPSPMNKRGFDVVSMMFSMHYAFENEKNARTMLRNVAGALKKGGRFIGCIPNSDVLGERVRQFNAKMKAKKKAQGGQDANKAEEQKNGENENKKPENGASADAADGDSPPHHPESPPHFAATPPTIADSPEFHPDSPGQPTLSPPHFTDNPNSPPGPASPPHHPDGAQPSPGAGMTAVVQSPNYNDDDKAASDGEVEEGEAEPTAEFGNSIYRVRFPGPTPEDGIFRPAFGWKYNFFLDEAVEEVPEYVVPWEAFRALADDYNLELQFHRTFPEVWEVEKDDPDMGPLSERMRVRGRGKGPLLVSDDEMEAASFYIGFCFYKV